MITDTDMQQRLNLVRTSGSFVLQEVGDQGEANVVSMTLVPKGSGVCWIRGQSIAKSGREIESVFRVDTNSSGTLASIFWWIDGKWYSHEDADALSALGLPKDGVFPFDWRFDIPLEDESFIRHEVWLTTCLIGLALEFLVLACPFLAIRSELCNSRT